MCCSTFIMTLLMKDSRFKFWPPPCSSLTSLGPSYDRSFQVQVITLLISTFRLVQCGSGTFLVRGDCSKNSFCWLQYLSQVQLFLKEEERISMLETAFLLRFVIMQYLLSLQMICLTSIALSMTKNNAFKITSAPVSEVILFITLRKKDNINKLVSNKYHCKSMQ